MDFMSYNKSLLNTKRIYKMDTKTMLFVVGRVVLGEGSQSFRFPGTGKIVDVYATCGKAGQGQTEIDVEKCDQIDFDGTPSWESIFTSKMLTIPNGKKSSTTENYTLNPLSSVVHLNDHFRLNVKEVGQGISDLNVEVVVELDVELN